MTEFAGYARTQAIEDQLVAALTAALHANPTQRLGQLLTNATGAVDWWNIYDEDLIERLGLYAKRSRQASR